MPSSLIDTKEKQRWILIAVFLLVLTVSPTPGPIRGAAASTPSNSATEAASGSRVEIQPSGEGFQLLRDGQPFYIKGIGGSDDMETAARLGANSVRTWAAQNLDSVLERAARCGMNVLAGIWLSHDPAAYLSDAYKERKTREVLERVEAHKDHPALLMWALGNEVNLEGADTRAAWQFIDQLASRIRRADPHHPVISVIAWKPETLDHIAAWAPHLDAVGINAYGALPSVRILLQKTAYEGPYLVTEWGVTGHWEADRTSWGRPIEPSSAAKAALVRRHYQHHIIRNKDRCLGSYVFLWGQKQERTPTWYSMLISGLPGVEEGPLLCPAVDVMGFNWSGEWPANRAPVVSGMRLNGRDAHADLSLSPGEPISAEVDASDPDAERLVFVWELMKEPKMLSVGGAHEPRPPTVGIPFRSEAPALMLKAPAEPGAYRLFVYVMDGSQRVGTVNIPFRVAMDTLWPVTPLARIP
jgi:hypothetical protein